MHKVIRPSGVAVVTGAAVGIGHAVAMRLAGHGMHLTLCDKDGAALERAAVQLRAAHRDVIVHCVHGDVTDALVRQRLYDQATACGDIAVLVNNAAVLKGAGPWESVAVWRAMLELNFWSVLELQALFVPWLIAQPGPAAIVNVGSKEGITTPPGNASYAVSKAALRVLTEQLAHELREVAPDRLSVHLLIPGYTFTPMNFPGADSAAAKPAAPWTADQVAQRMLEGMAAGDFYLFCEDNEVSRELDQCRLQWSADDLILNRPALSRWHPAYREQFADFIKGVVPGSNADGAR